jgi:hypothetical protein
MYYEYEYITHYSESEHRWSIVYGLCVVVSIFLHPVASFFLVLYRTTRKEDLIISIIYY